MKKFTISLLAVILSTLALIIDPIVVCAAENNTGETAYVNGGIGEAETDSIRASAGSYNLRLYLSESKNGNFITGAQVTIIDKKGNVLLDITDGGPMLFMNVKNGSYTIVAKYNDVTLTRKAIVGNHRGKNVYLNWKTVENQTEDVSMEK